MRRIPEELERGLGMRNKQIVCGFIFSRNQLDWKEHNVKQMQIHILGFLEVLSFGRE